ncbi:MAG: SpoIIE family protein phosphatase [Phycisphaerae bacterium]|nr:SpoIIE family protein phosphatase [Phycisphaerae bacterium]
MAGTRQTSSARPFDSFEYGVLRDIQAAFSTSGCQGWPGASVASARVGQETRSGDFHVTVRGVDEQLVICVGTIEGGGAFGAMAKAALCGAIRGLAPEARSPLTIVRAVDDLLRQLNADLGRGSVTCSLFAGVLDHYDETMTVVSLGSIALFLRMEDGSIKAMEPEGPALGVTTNLVVSARTLCANKVRRLVVGTAAATQTGSHRGPTVGASRFRRWVAETSGLPPREQAEVLARSLGDFLGSEEPRRETDVIVIELLGAKTPEELAPALRDRLFGRFPDSPGADVDPSVFLG